MKKTFLIGLILLLTIPCIAIADINKGTVENQVTDLLSNLKGKLSSDTLTYVRIRQKIEDQLAQHLSQLDSADQTKLSALPTELQDIIDEIDDLISKISTHYPTVQ